MSRLDRHPQVVQLAKELGLQGSGDWIAKIQRYARDQVEIMIRQARVPIRSLDKLLQLLADRLSVTIEYVGSDADLERIATEHQFSHAEYRRLVCDLDDPEIDGLLIKNPDARPGSREFLAVVDARGDQASRAYFTAWHEVVHLLITPSQRAFEGVYRSISATRPKDPEESVVDAVAGELAFFEPLVRPVVNAVLAGNGRLSFDLIEEVRKRAAPGASFYATAIAVVRLAEQPALLVQVKPALKAEEVRQICSGQQELDLGGVTPELRAKLRLTDAIPTRTAKTAGLRIFKKMRVPERSVLTEVYRSAVDVVASRAENQDWWETSSAGALPSLPLLVEAVRRGLYVYGLISPAS